MVADIPPTVTCASGPCGATGRRQSPGEICRIYVVRHQQRMLKPDLFVVSRWYLLFGTPYAMSMVFPSDKPYSEDKQYRYPWPLLASYNTGPTGRFLSADQVRTSAQIALCVHVGPPRTATARDREYLPTLVIGKHLAVYFQFLSVYQSFIWSDAPILCTEHLHCRFFA